MKVTASFGWRHVVLLIFMTILLSPMVWSLGVAPSTKDILFEQNLETTVSVKVINRDGAPFTGIVYAEGPLQEYIQLSENTVRFEEGETEKIIRYKVSLPEKLKGQGDILTNIIIRQTRFSDEKEGTAVLADLAIGHTVRVRVPYDDQYAEALLYVSNYKQNTKSYFSIKVANLGVETLKKVYAIVQVLGPDGSRIAELKSDTVSIAEKKESMLSIEWTPKIGAGVYTAVATVYYGNKTVEDRKPFTIGEPDVDIEAISVDTFSLGGIAKFDLQLASKWNLPIENLYGTVTVTDKEGRVFSNFKTAAETLGPFERRTLEAFWDTADATAGKYRMKIVLSYLNKKSEELYDIFVETNKIIAQPMGFVVDETPRNQFKLGVTGLLVVVIIVLAVMNYFLMRRMKKKGERGFYRNP